MMENSSGESLSEYTAHTLLDILAPGSELISISVPDGSFSNFTHVVEACWKDGNHYKFVVRRYKVFGDYDRGEKAGREFKTFKLLNLHDLPAPEALYLDETGEVLGMPGIVTRFVPGCLLLEAPSDPRAWARKLARTLAKIHAIECSQEEQAFLLKGNAEAVWFLKSDAPPPYMQEYPGGAEVWHTLRNHVSQLESVPPVLLHLDYWSGNILWHEEEISAVIDWEEAAYGDPAVDVAYAYMNILLMDIPEAAYDFLHTYRSETGRELSNLGFWELAASVRSMTDPVDWKVAELAEPGATILQNFIRHAKERVEARRNL